ncbi:excalibur calcium-binding domain-containing protein [Yaniella flava]|uniref:excalibur calcium-binding domain-containing protein n=1 Tax=Yaniella flava TaxID=287930 RepID=UPI0031D08777
MGARAWTGEHRTLHPSEVSDHRAITTNIPNHEASSTAPTWATLRSSSTLKEHQDAAKAEEEAREAEQERQCEEEAVQNAPAPTPTAPAQNTEPSTPNGAYENCTAAREAGAAQVHRGEPGYGTHLDRDGDGVGCE